MELIEKYLGEATRCTKCGMPLNSKAHKENCDGSGKGKKKRKGKYELQDIPGHQGWTRYKDRDAKK
jgi:hypothetical protein